MVLDHYRSATPRNADWWPLLEALCDACATESQRRAVAFLLRTDDTFRRFFVAYTCDEAALYEPRCDLSML